MEEQNRQDEALFEQLKKKKQKKKRKVHITVLAVILVLVVALAVGVPMLQSRVQSQFALASDTKQAQVTVGRISTSVSGSGTLRSVDAEQVTLASGVELEEVLVSVGDAVRKGDALASVKLSSVLTALSDAQKELDDLDEQIEDAKDDATSTYMSSKIGGRVKAVYGQPDDVVADCVAEYGALAVLSLDGCMAVDIEAALSLSQQVQVTTPNGKQYDGTVIRVADGISTITLTDDGPKLDALVTVSTQNGDNLGEGRLYIHRPLSITGYTGSISGMNIKENQLIYKGTSLFTLRNTASSASYNALLQEREEKQADYLALLDILKTGNLCASMDGTVVSVDEGQTGTNGKTAVVTLAPNEKMEVQLSIDESDILALEIGQSAEVTVSSLGDDVIHGVVTDVSKAASSSSGMTGYAAVVTVDKTEKMLAGMTAEVEIQIEGGENALLLPVESIQRTSTSTYVYTSYDEQTRQYGGIVIVETGVSGSKFIEIKSGLQEGDRVYYEPKDTSSSFGAFGGGMSPMGRGTGAMVGGG